MVERISVPGAGRYAPSPSGDLHLGNLRTAALAWAFARAEGKNFVLRVEDLDRVKAGSQKRQLEDLAAIGLDWDPPVLVQSSRDAAHHAAVVELSERGLTYECFCTRREIQAQIASAGGAPHGAPGAYPGTCRALSPAQRQRRRRDRPPAIRLRSDTQRWNVYDRWAGEVTGEVDDLVLLRNDGRPAYNLAVVVDDAFQGVGQVVRADDLLSSAPRQAYLATLLGLPGVEYLHVPLVVNAAGQRLAKRDGAVTLRELDACGVDAGRVVSWLLTSMGVDAQPGTVRGMLQEINAVDAWLRTRPEPWVFSPPQTAPRSTG